jgi:hypothetical protein
VTSCDHSLKSRQQSIAEATATNRGNAQSSPVGNRLRANQESPDPTPRLTDAIAASFPGDRSAPARLARSHSMASRPVRIAGHVHGRSRGRSSSCRGGRALPSMPASLRLFRIPHDQGSLGWYATASLPTSAGAALRAGNSPAASRTG